MSKSFGWDEFYKYLYDRVEIDHLTQENVVVIWEIGLAAWNRAIQALQRKDD